MLYTPYHQKVDRQPWFLNDTYALQPRWSSDSKKIYYTVSVDENNQSWQNRGLAVVPAEGGKGTILTRNKDAKRSEFHLDTRQATESRLMAKLLFQLQNYQMILILLRIIPVHKYGKFQSMVVNQ